LRYHQAILVSCQIPWDEQERLLEQVFRQEIGRLISQGFNNVYIFGTAGEGYAVDTPRFEQIVRIFREETRSEGVMPQVGVIGLSTANIVGRLGFAYDLGFRVFQISLPSWGALNDFELLTFFRDVSTSFPDARFLHYNLPRAKRVLNARDYRRIVDEVPNLVATKNTSASIAETAALMRVVPELQHFFGEEQFPIGCLYGECSLLSSFAPMLPRRTIEFFELGRTRQWDRLFLMMRDYMKVVYDVLAPTEGLSLIDGAYDKMLIRLGGLDFPLRLLSPYQGMPEEVFDACSKILYERYSDWLG